MTPCRNDMIRTLVSEHIESDHKGQKPFICTVCQKGFTTNLSLKVHIETIHEGKKPFECPICKASFGQKTAMNRHINSLHAEIDEKLKPHICDLCNASFARQSHLKGHINSVHDKKSAEISEQDTQIKKIKILDPYIIKEEQFDTISEDNGDLNFSGINGEYLDGKLILKDDNSAIIDNKNSEDLFESLEGTKGEENSEMVFAENLDTKEEYSKESNNQKDSDYDPLMSLTISADEAYQYYKNNLFKQGVKGGTFENAKKILEWKKVEIKPRPKSDLTLNRKWQSEQARLVSNLDRILQLESGQRINEKGQKSRSVKYFFELSKYQTLTILNPEMLTPEILNPEIGTPEIGISENNANYQILKGRNRDSSLYHLNGFLYSKNGQSKKSVYLYCNERKAFGNSCPAFANIDRNTNKMYMKIPHNHATREKEIELNDLRHSILDAASELTDKSLMETFEDKTLLYSDKEDIKDKIKYRNLESGMRKRRNEKLPRLPKEIEEPQTCADCGKVFSSKMTLSLHIKMIHGNEKPHVCDQCSKGFATKKQLKNHIVQSHCRQTCEHCGKSVLNEFFLKKHIVFDHGIKDSAFICDICPKKVFSNEKGYKKHLRRKHNRKK